MMDIVERLRMYRAIDPTSSLIVEAADEIESLRQQLAAMMDIRTERELKLATVTKERDDFERRWLGALNVPQAIHQQEMIDASVLIMRQIRADLDANDVLNEWLPVIDNALAKLGADKGGNK